MLGTHRVRGAQADLVRQTDVALVLIHLEVISRWILKRVAALTAGRLLFQLCRWNFRGRHVDDVRGGGAWTPGRR
jgi:hypothetical protein